MSAESLPRTYHRDEMLLGRVSGIYVSETDDAIVSYELNVIDGWVKITDLSDDGGITYRMQTSDSASVRDVLDAAPGEAAWVAKVHLAWCEALKTAGDSRAKGQRSSLTWALKAHGLRVAKPAPEPKPRCVPVKAYTPKRGDAGTVITYSDGGRLLTGTVWAREGKVGAWVIPDGWQAGDVLTHVRLDESGNGRADWHSAPDRAATVARERVIIDAGTVVVSKDDIEYTVDAPVYGTGPNGEQTCTVEPKSYTRQVRRAHLDGCPSIGVNGHYLRKAWHFLADQYGHGVDTDGSKMQAVDYCPDCLPLKPAAAPVESTPEPVAVAPVEPVAAPVEASAVESVMVPAMGAGESLTMSAPVDLHETIRRLSPYLSYGHRYDRAVADTIRDCARIWHRGDFPELAAERFAWILKRVRDTDHADALTEDAARPVEAPAPVEPTHTVECIPGVTSHGCNGECVTDQLNRAEREAYAYEAYRTAYFWARDNRSGYWPATWSDFAGRVSSGELEGTLPQCWGQYVETYPHVVPVAPEPVAPRVMHRGHPSAGFATYCSPKAWDSRASLDITGPTTFVRGDVTCPECVASYSPGWHPRGTDGDWRPVAERMPVEAPQGDTEQPASANGLRSVRRDPLRDMTGPEILRAIGVDPDRSTAGTRVEVTGHGTYYVTRGRVIGRVTVDDVDRRWVLCCLDCWAEIRPTDGGWCDTCRVGDHADGLPVRTLTPGPVEHRTTTWELRESRAVFARNAWRDQTSAGWRCSCGDYGSAHDRAAARMGARSHRGGWPTARAG